MVILHYQPKLRSRPAWYLFRTAVLCALLLAIAIWLKNSNTVPSGPPNLPWSYPGRLGVDNALEAIHAAVRQYALSHNDLPDDLQNVGPFLVPPKAARSVTAADILPHVALVRLDKGPATHENDDEQFVLLVYLLKGGAMLSDRMMISRSDPSTQFDIAQSYTIDDAVQQYGRSAVLQAKQRAYQIH